MSCADECECLEELGEALARIEMPEATEHRAAFDGGGCNVRDRPRRVGDVPDGPVVAALARPFLDVMRVRNQPRGVREDLPDQWKLVRPRLPDGRYPSVEDAVGEQASGDARISLHRGEVTGAVLVSDRQA